MNDFERLSSDLQKQIDRLCDEFEENTDGKSLHHYVLQVEDTSAQRSLFAELVAIELGRCSTEQRSTRLRDLTKQFPKYTEMLDEFRRSESSHSRREKPAADTLAAGSDTKPEIQPNGPLPAEYKPQQSVGQYQLLEVVGTGAFGKVWRAFDTALNRTVAIKLPRRGDLSESDVKRFTKEARLAAQLNHPNIVSVHEIDTHQGTPFIVSDFIKGTSVSEWSLNSKPGFQTIARLCASISEALHHAHKQGIVHRDLKPTNVLVDTENEPHVADFGLAKSLADETMTMEGNLLGSPAYMSPEQAKGDAAKADRRSDVYSLGVILYELIVGERPFRGSPDSVMHQVIHSEPASPRTIAPRVPKDLETICLNCLSKDSDQRYQSAQLLADDLRRFESGVPIHARPISSIARVWSWSKRNPGYALALALATSLLLLLAVGGPWLAASIEKERKMVVRQRSLRALSTIATRFKKSGSAGALPVIEDELANGDPEILSGFPFRHLHYQATHIGERKFVTNTELITVSPTDEFAVFADENRNLVLWDLESGQSIRKFSLEPDVSKPSEGPASTSAFSPDGQRLAVGDEVIRVFDVASGNLERIYPLDVWHAGEDMPDDYLMQGIDQVCWSSDQKWIAYTAWNNKHVRVLNVATGETSIVDYGYNHDGYKAHANAFSPNSNELATAGFDGNIKLWSIESGELTHTFPVHNEWGRQVIYSRNGKMLAYTDDANIYIRDTETKELLRIWAFPGAFSLAFSPGDEYLVCGSWSNLILVVNIKQPMEQFKLRGHRSCVRSVAFSRDGRLLSRETQNNNVVDWGKLDQLSNRIVKHEQEIKSISISTDQKYVAAVGDDGVVSITEIESRKRIAEFSVLREALNLSRSQVARLDFNPAISDYSLAVLAENEVVLWSGPGQPMRTLQPQLNTNTSKLTSLQFSPKGSLLVCGDSDGNLWYWETKTWAVQKWEYAEGAINEITFHGDGRMAIAHVSDARGSVAISCLDIADRRAIFGPIDARSTHTVGLHFQPDGDLLASSSRKSVANLWDANTGEHVKAIDPVSIYVLCVAFSPNGKYLATGTGSIKLWEMQDIAETIALDIEMVPIYTLEFAQDGSFLLSAGHDDTVRIWRAPQLPGK